MHQTLQTVAAGLAQQISEAIETASENYAGMVIDVVEHYRSMYEHTVAELVREHQRRENILTARRNLLQDASTQTQRRRATVNAQRERLTTRGGTRI
jgi:hypothetical protein